jgi:hypothetical protein
MERELEKFNQILQNREGTSINTYTRDAFKEKFPGAIDPPPGRKPNWAKLQDGDIHIVDDIYRGPRGAAEVAHEYGASKLIDYFGSRDKVPDFHDESLTHWLDDQGGFLGKPGGL